ncbi:hypothetical protein LJC08_01205 [Methanimicrococcus sp. OttesenSCG-928-J09]|nr:hypothetical protein [Methanimicrococcus sp. OttesenSCG-928-J09]
MHEATIDEILVPTGRIIKPTPEEMERIKEDIAFAKKDWDERMERAKKGLMY